MKAVKSRMFSPKKTLNAVSQNIYSFPSNGCLDMSDNILSFAIQTIYISILILYKR